MSHPKPQRDVHDAVRDRPLAELYDLLESAAQASAAWITWDEADSVESKAAAWIVVRATAQEQTEALARFTVRRPPEPLSYE